MSCSCIADSIESCLDHIRGRNVEEIRVLVNVSLYLSVGVPASVFNNPSLVVLDLDAWIYHPDFDNIGTLSLPNLKELRLRLYGRGNNISIGTLFKYCPLLQVLKLLFELEFYFEYEGEHLIDISCPNLESLDLSLNGPARCKIMINAPKLLKIDIDDYISSYCFVERPSRLVQAYFRLEHVEEDVDHLRDAMASQIIGTVRSVTYLKLGNSNKILKYLSSMQHGVTPVFPNLCKFQTSINISDPLCWKDLLLCLRCFPNLEEVKVDMWTPYRSTKHVDLSFVNYLPGCLLGKVKWLEFTRMAGNNDDVKLLRYIVRKATVLERLVVKLRSTSYRKEHVERQLWKEYKFSKALFKLPRSSSRCKIEFFGFCIDHASSEAFENGRVTCQIRYVDYYSSDSTSSSTN